MAAVPATRALTKRKPPDGARPLDLGGVDEALTELLGQPPRRDRLERDDRMYRLLVRKGFAEGQTFRTTYRQLAAGLGYELSGNPDRDYARYHSRIERALGSLRAAGLIRCGGVKRPDGRWHCLEVELLGGSRRRNAGERTGTCGGDTRRVRRRRNCPVRRPLDKAGQPGHRYKAPPGARRIFFGTEVGGPEGLSLLRRANPTRELFARARGAPSERRSEVNTVDGAASPPANGNAGSESLGPRPTDDPGEPALSVLAAAFRELFGQDPRFSIRTWGPTLGRALRRCNRYGDFGARAPGGGGALRPGRRVGVELLLGAMEEHAEQVSLGKARVPSSLAYFVPWLDQVSKDFRRQQKPRLKKARRAEGAARRAGGTPLSTEGD